MKGEVRLKEAIGKCGVIVRKAPTGMVRAKQNKTFWSQKKKCVVWTVEWIHNGGRSELGTCPAYLPILEAYATHCAPSTQNKKRKRDSEPSPPSIPTTSHLPPRPPPLPSASATSPSSPPANPSLYFYLLRPRTPPSTRVLIPFPDSTATLATSLRDRHVLEFPTIYALKYPPEKLPTGFVTEADYLAQQRPSGQREGVIGFGSNRGKYEKMWSGGATEHAETNDHADGIAGGDGAGNDEGEAEEVVDANRFLAVLARDLGA